MPPMYRGLTCVICFIYNVVSEIIMYKTPPGGGWSIASSRSKICIFLFGFFVKKSLTPAPRLPNPPPPPPHKKIIIMIIQIWLLYKTIYLLSPPPPITPPPKIKKERKEKNIFLFFNLKFFEKQIHLH